MSSNAMNDLIDWLLDEKGVRTSMATTSTTSPYRRASDVSQGIGKKLDEIIGQDVLLVNFRADQRPQGIDRSEKTILMLTLALDPSKPSETTLFHAWSQSLSDRLVEIPGDELPLLIKFVKVATASGTNAWSFE